jgi:hypothetical protein
MIIVLSIIVIFLCLSIVYLIRHIKLINEELILLGKEQHTQNMDIIELMKELNTERITNNEQDKALLMIIQYINNQEPVKVPYMGVIGQA